MSSSEPTFESNPVTILHNCWLLPAFWIAMGIFFASGSTLITTAAVQDHHDPGPTAICLLCAVALIALGVFQLVQMIWRAFQTPAAEPIQPPTATAASSSTSPGQVGFTRAVTVVTGVALYIIAIFYIGFAMATLVFGITMMKRLNISWLLSISATGLALATVYFVFIRVLGIVLPTGIWGSPF